METKKKQHKYATPHPWRPVLLGCIAVILLLAAILLLGKHLPSEPQPTEPTLPLLEPNPYPVEAFTWEDGFLKCAAEGSMLGIDVSEHQQDVDWAQVKEAGIEFVMIRVGFRGYTEGKLFDDANFHRHLAGAREAGLKVGVYFFSQAITPEEAREEADFLLNILDHRTLDMPVAFDWEYIGQDARTGTMNSPTLTDCAITFCETVKNAGYKPMVYFNPDLAHTLLPLETLTDYDFWLAMYTDEMTFPHRVNLWQYTQSGTVPGIDGDVDVNLYLP